LELSSFTASLVNNSQIKNAAKIAPLGTMIVAMAAFLIAWRSLSAQKSIAQKRADIDVFLSVCPGTSIFK